MTTPLKYTTVEAAAKLGITPLWFRLLAKSKGIKAGEVVVSGKRGRPADLWTAAQVKAIAS